MDREELRSHLRVRAHARAVLRLQDGTRVRCRVVDVSMGGAYLLRQVLSEGHVFEAGDMLELSLQPEKGNATSWIDVEIVRKEPGGPGLAVRFHLTKEVRDPVVDFVVLQGRAAGIEPAALGRPEVRTTALVGRALGAAARLLMLAGVIVLGWGVWVVQSWLSTVL